MSSPCLWEGFTISNPIQTPSRRYWRPYLLLLCCGSGYLWSECEGAETQLKPDIQLQLQPKLCVISPKETQCNEPLLVQWQSLTQQRYDVCLYQQGETQALKCWQEVSLGTAELNYVIRQSQQFALKDRSQQLLATQTYEVIVEAIHYQRPRRNPWSFY